MAADRLACVYIPGFPLQVARRDTPELAECPVVIAERPGDSSPLVVVNRAARENEISPVMTVTQARSRCPGLKVAVRSHEREDEESGKLLKLLQKVGPFVEEHAPGTYFLQASGLAGLYRTENNLARKILTELRPSGYPLKVGIAANKLVARVAAELAGRIGYRLIVAGEERAFLSPLTVEHLFLPEETLEKLHTLGIRTVGQLAAFPAQEITRRFGDEVIALARYVRGEDNALFLPEQLTVRRSERLILDYPVYAGRNLVAHLTRLLGKLLMPLKRSGRGCRALVLQFVCEDRTKTSLRITVDRPTASVRTFLRQTRRTLERYRLESGITDITVIVPSAVSLDAEQLDLDHKTAADNTDRAVAAMEWKAHHVYGITKQPQTLPERGYELVEPAATSKTRTEIPGNGVAFPPYAMRPVYGLRLLTPAQPVTVETESGRLLRLKMDYRTQAITRQNGPWRLSGNWWNEATFNRLYYEIETDRGQTFLLFYDWLVSDGESAGDASASRNTAGRGMIPAVWYLQGVFD